MTTLPSTGTPQTVFTSQAAGCYVLVKTSGAGTLMHGSNEVIFTESEDGAQETSTIFMGLFETLTWQGVECELRGFRIGDEF